LLEFELGVLANDEASAFWEEFVCTPDVCVTAKQAIDDTAFGGYLRITDNHAVLDVDILQC
jgi:hypothetical protein